MPLSRNLIEQFQKEFEDEEPTKIEKWVQKYYGRYKKEEHIRERIKKKA